MTREEICKNLKTIITQINETIGNRYKGINSTYIADIKPNSLRFVIEEAIKALEQEPCSDSVSMEAVIEWLKDKDIIKLKSQEENARKELQQVYSVNPQQKTGHWIPSHITESILDECSECGFSCGAFTFNYCPKCGARMLEPKESEE